MENEDWIISLSLSKPREVKWLKGSDSIIETSEKYEVSVTDDGLTHTLIIRNIVMGDGGVYAVEINDKEYGAITSFASLNVKGTSCIATLLSTNHSSRFYSTTEIISIGTSVFGSFMLVNLSFLNHFHFCE